MKDPRDVILAPVVSEKSYDLIENNNTYTFVVDTRTNKEEIKDAVAYLRAVANPDDAVNLRRIRELLDAGQVEPPGRTAFEARDEARESGGKATIPGTEAHNVDRPGGIYVRRTDQMSDEDRLLFQAVARIPTPFLVLQFFIFPMAIVAVCVAVFVVFGLVASGPKDPRAILAEVRTGASRIMQETIS